MLCDMTTSEVTGNKTMEAGLVVRTQWLDVALSDSSVNVGV